MVRGKEENAFIRKTGNTSMGDTLIMTMFGLAPHTADSMMAEAVAGGCGEPSPAPKAEAGSKRNSTSFR